MIHFMRLVSIISKCEVSCDVIMGRGVERADSGGGNKNKNDCLNFFLFTEWSAKFVQEGHTTWFWKLSISLLCSIHLLSWRQYQFYVQVNKTLILSISVTPYRRIRDVEVTLHSYLTSALVDVSGHLLSGKRGADVTLVGRWINAIAFLAIRRSRNPIIT